MTQLLVIDVNVLRSRDSSQDSEESQQSRIKFFLSVLQEYRDRGWSIVGAKNSGKDKENDRKVVKTLEVVYQEYSPLLDAIYIDNSDRGMKIGKNIDELDLVAIQASVKDQYAPSMRVYPLALLLSLKADYHPQNLLYVSDSISPREKIVATLVKADYKEIHEFCSFVDAA